MSSTSSKSVLTHVVLFKFAADYPHVSAASEDAKQFLTLPGVLSVQFGETFTTQRAEGHTHVLVVTFDSREALPVYTEHEIHKAWAAKYVAPYKQGILAVDVDTPKHAKI